MWTVEEVKERLPDIRVRLPDGAEIAGTLSGRRDDYASVSVLVHGLMVTEQVSWTTVVRCLNTDHPVRF